MHIAFFLKRSKYSSASYAKKQWLRSWFSLEKAQDKELSMHRKKLNKNVDNLIVELSQLS